MMLAALQEHESSLGPHGLPLDETTSPLADPDNPERQWEYGVRVIRDFATSAVEARESDFKDDPSRARIFAPYRIDH
ncbi:MULTISPECIES: hypothetical protein [unclassified Microbacterium]|uniref:hypothetical protein n=1 Tax=unclassified Microbacterium TaxID=2609290 RepID=UPI000EA9C5B1|nr:MULTISPECIES: hypothetical protein [unclassified Microbacterium]MBT2485815.1 hypothetical protein [Microbacterium sp. ISL-108]RKN68578.1 hypothetical protein D7252_13955 [Microbacterium sp. CGR2]